ncbi:chromate transporter [Alkalibacter mobilis]|uniref:chromate transporter n=1 Tax=Alkalibacter mobilis TaxID=2787712 RepID=UPI00189F531D|nr:chromate transporter [Alkalibacter mobilis]MBF7096169.1 chromate transporter [Alkalibacter mobilis]
MKILFEIFKSFFKIGAFTVGGGYAMLPLFEDEFINKKKWFTDQDFLNMLTVATASPGPLAVNSAVYTGYHVAGVKGIIAAVVGVIISPVVIILILAANYEKFRSLEFANPIFSGIRPAVVGLMFAAVFNLVKKNRLRWTWYTLSILSFALISFIKVDPVIVIGGAALLGVLFQKYLERRR